MNLMFVRPRRWLPGVGIVLMLVSGGWRSTLCAANYSWFGGTGDWNLSSNWNPAGIPNSADTATITSGTVTVSDNRSVSTMVLNGGTVAGGGTLTIATSLVWQAGSMVGGGGQVIIASSAQAQVSNITATVVLGSRRLENRGTLIWSGSSPWLMHTSATLTNAPTGTIEVKNSVPLISSNLNCRIDNAGLFRKSGVTGATVFNPHVTGTPNFVFNNQGTLAVHQGSLDFQRAVLQGAATSIIQAGLGGATPGSQFGQVVVSNSFTLTGSLAVQLLNGFVPKHGDVFPILLAPLSGTFASVTGTNLGVGKRLQVDYSTNQVVLRTFSDRPEILLQPVSHTVIEGTPVTFSVQAGGAPPLTFQWFYNGTPLSGATSSNYTISATTTFDAGNFYCAVANGFGGTNSATVTLNVLPPVTPPVIANVSVMGNGVNISFATQTGYDYALEIASNGNGPWLPISTLPGTGNIMNMTDPGASAQQLRLYRVRVTPIGGGFDLYSINIVGLANILAAPGYTLMANPFFMVDANLNTVFPVVPDGAGFIAVGPAGFEEYYYFDGFGWVDFAFESTTKQLATGEGGYFYNPTAGNLALTLIGEVPMGNLTNALPAGRSIITSLVLGAGLANFPASQDDAIWTWSATSQRLEQFTFAAGAWLPSAPILTPGGAVWCQPAAAKNWVATFGGDIGGYRYQPFAYTGGNDLLAPAPAGPLRLLEIPSYSTATGSTLRVIGTAGHQVQVQRSANGVDWTALGTFAIPTNGAFTLNDPSVAGFNLYKVYDLADEADFPEVVGYMNLNVPTGYSLLANQFLNATNTVAALLQPAIPGLTVFKPVAGRLTANNYLNGWTDPNMTLMPGESFWLYNPGTALNLTCKGRLLQGGLTNNLPAGYSYPASMLPEYGTTGTLLPNMPDGANLYLWNGVSFTVDNYFEGFGWLNGSAIAAGQGFILQLPSATQLIRNFTLTSGGGYTVSPAPANTVGLFNFFTYNPAGAGNGRVLGTDGSTPLNSFYLGQWVRYNGGTIVEAGPPRYFGSGVGAGYLNGQTFAITGASLGSAVTFAIRAWNSLEGTYTTYDDAVAAGMAHGESAQFNVTAGGTYSPPAALNTFPSFSVQSQQVAPFIIEEPANQIRLAGGQATFAVIATGTPPLRYQWYFNGDAISGATNANLVLGNLTATQQGGYYVVVSNDADSVSSAQAWLEVAPEDPYIFVNSSFSPSGVHYLPDDEPAWVEMWTTFDGGFIYVSTNALHPDNGFLYTAPFFVRPPIAIKAIAYDSQYAQWTPVVTKTLIQNTAYDLVLGTPGGGSVSAVPGPGPYPINTVVTLNATPSNGWIFMRWEGDARGTNPVTQVLMNQHRNVTAVFGTTISLSLQGSGGVIFDPPGRVQEYGTRMQATALPNAGSYFQLWGGILAGQTNIPATFVVTNAAPSVTARFAILPANNVSLSILVNGAGSVLRNPAASYYLNGSSVTLTAQPDPGYYFAGWSGDVTATNPVISVAMKGNRTVTANFVANQQLAFGRQPQSQVVTVGGTATFNVVAYGLGVEYYWLFEGQFIPGENSPTLIVNNVTKDMEGKFQAMIINEFGWLLSEPAWLTVNLAASPVLQAQTVTGGAVNEAALALAVRSNDVYVAGYSELLGSEGVAARYAANFTSNAAPLWQTNWPGQPGSDWFLGALAVADGVVLAGQRTMSIVTASESKGVLVKLGQADGTEVFVRQTPTQPAFAYNGFEFLRGIAASTEADGQFWYVCGQGQSDFLNNGRMLIAKVNPTGSNLWVATDPGLDYAYAAELGLTTANLNDQTMKEFSGGRAVVVAGGAVYVAGRADYQGVAYAALWKYSLTGQLLWLKTSGEGEYNGVACANGFVYTVGAAPDFAGGQNFLVEKWHPDGYVYWSESPDRAGADETLMGVVVAGNRLYAAGYTYGGTAGNADAILMRFDTETGQLISTTVEGGAQIDFATAIALQGQQIFMAGQTASTGAGGSDFWLLRYTAPDLIVNAEPAVVITSPTNNATFTEPTSFAISVSATDSDGFISRVELYVNGGFYAEDLSTPYNFSLSQLSMGDYLLQARAYDNQGAFADSYPILIKVTDYAEIRRIDFESILLGTNGTASGLALNNYLSTFGVQVFNLTAGTTVRVARVSAVYPGLVTPSSGFNLFEQVGAARAAVTNRLEFDRIMARVQFTRVALEAGSLGATHPRWRARALNRYGVELSSAGESAIFSLRDVPAQTFTLTGPDIAAVVFESDPQNQARFNSALLDDLTLVVAIKSNIPPSAIILSPADGAAFTGPTNLVVNVRTEDFDGQVVRLGLWLNGEEYQFINNPITAPGSQSFTLANLPTGEYELAALAQDNQGEERFSKPVRFAVKVPAPANDRFANRLLLTGLAATNAGNTLGATSETGEPLHADEPGGRSVWFTWTAPVDGLVEITTAGSSFDTLLAVYAGSTLGNLVLITANDDSDLDTLAFTSRVQFHARRGETYHIAVDGYSGDAGAYRLVLTMNQPPAITFLQPADGAVISAPASLLLEARAADANGIARIEFYRGTFFLGAVNNGALTSPFTAQFNLSNLKEGNYTFLARAVDGQGVANISSPVSVTVRAAVENNDNFANARLLTGVAATVTNDNRSATREAGEPNPFFNPYGNTLWYRWTAPSSGQVVISTLGSSFDTQMAVYTGSALNNLTLITADDDSGDAVNEVFIFSGGGASLVSFPVTAGITYQIAVEGYYGAFGLVRLTLALSQPPTITLTLNENEFENIAPGVIPLVADARDDQAIRRVDFLYNDEVLGYRVNPANSTSMVAQLTLTNAAAGRYIFVARAVDALGVVTHSAPLPVEIFGVESSPVLTGWSDDLDVLRGEKIELNVAAQGSPPLVYQWYFNGLPLGSATNANLVIPNATPGNSGIYYAVVVNPFGFEITDDILVRVFTPPVITAPPQPVTVAPGGSATFAVTASGTAPLRYQWYRNQQAIPGATAATLVLSNLQVPQAGQYIVVVTNRAGAAQAAVNLTVDSALLPPSSQSRDDFWVTDGPVHALAEAGGTIYLGGDFRMVGPNTGLGAGVDADSGQPDMAFPKVEGAAIHAVVRDNLGGWFIGGDFNRVGGLTRSNLARIRADKSVDPTWTLGSDQPVLALALAQETLYLGGTFTRVGGLVRSNLAALRTQDQTVLNYAPNPDNQVRAIAVANEKVFIGGLFLNVGGKTRARLAVLNDKDGIVLDSWNLGVDRAVHAMVAVNNLIYVGGEFDSLTNNGVTHTRFKVAALDASSEDVTGWQIPMPSGNSARIYALAAGPNWLYAGGDFAFTANGISRRHLAAASLVDGSLAAWNPIAGGQILALTVSGDTLYTGGAFNSIAGQNRQRLAAVQAETGALLPWNPGASATVRALAAQENTVFAGGQFTIVGGVMRSNLAAMRLATGQATSWNPGANGIVSALAVAGTNVYAAGEFTTAGGQARNRLAAISTANGQATAWNPGANGAVRALAVAGKQVFIGGEFTQLGGQARSYAGLIDAETALTAAWNPNPDGAVYALAATPNGSQVYLGGVFQTVGGLTRKFLARVGADGQVDGWRPLPDGAVMSLALGPSTSTVLYAAGYFTHIGGQSRERLAALDGNALALPNFVPAVSSSASEVAAVRAVVVSSNLVFAGGIYDTASTSNRNNLASFGVNSGVPGPWNPDLTRPAKSLAVRALAAAENVVYVGGDFVRAGGGWRPYFAVYVPKGSPFISSQPRGRMVTPGGSHTMGVAASGAAPLAYQWRLNGVNLPSATNATLALGNIQAAQAGAYSVVVISPFGAVESQSAMVTLNVPLVGFGDRYTNEVTLPAVANGMVWGLNTDATAFQDDQLPSGFKRGGKSVWASWIAPTNGVATFSNAGSTFDTLLAVLQGDTLATLMTVARDEDSAGNLNERVTFPVTMGNTYHVLLDGVEGANGTILLGWNLLVGVSDYPIITDQPVSRSVPPNGTVNLQVTAQNAAAYQWFFKGEPISRATNASYAIASMQASNAGPYYVIAYGTNPVRQATSRAFVLELGQIVQTNTPTTLTEVRSHDKFDDMLKGGGLGGQALNAPERPFFASVSAGSSGTQVLDNYGSTSEPGEPQHGGQQGGSSRWFRIDVLTNGVLVVDTIGSGIDTVLAVYQGASLLELELIASDDNGAPDGIRSRVTFTATNGQSYLVAVDGVNGAQGQIFLNYALGVPPTITTPPANQSAAGGSTVGFSVLAAGTSPLSYQWYLRRTSETNATPIFAATNATLTLTNVQVSDAGSLQVVAANFAGAVTSSVATLTVEPPMRFTTGGGSSYSNGVFSLTISGKAGQTYIIQGSSDLQTWIPLQTNIATGGAIQFADPTAGTTRRYYRAVGLP